MIEPFSSKQEYLRQAALIYVGAESLELLNTTVGLDPEDRKKAQVAILELISPALPNIFSNITGIKLNEQTTIELPMAGKLSEGEIITLDDLKSRAAIEEILIKLELS